MYAFCNSDNNNSNDTNSNSNNSNIISYLCGDQILLFSVGLRKRALAYNVKILPPPPHSLQATN